MPTNKGKELIALDFTEHDTVALLEYLLGLCKENRVAGMVYAVSLKHARKHPHFCGSTGVLATDLVKAAGVGAMLQLKLSQEAMEASMHQD